MGKLTAGYIRVSTEMQVERDSLINQEEMIANFARSRGKEWKIYRDAGISAKDKDRPAFQAMLNDIKKDLVEAVVVTKLDRITRRLNDLIFLKDFFEENGVAFISITQNLDTSTPMGRFSFYILGLVAELEREMTAERVAEDMKGRARRGKWNGGVVPYGFTYQIDSKNLAIDPKESEIVKTIYHLYLKHKSFRNVVHSLNSTGIKTRDGKPWSSTSVHRILQNPIYYGALTYNKRKSAGKTSKPRPIEEHLLIEDVFNPIIPKDRFLEIQGIIAGQKKIPPSSKHSQYLLTGLLECQLCGSKMYGYTYSDPRKEGRLYRYYRCNGHISKGTSVCPGNTVDSRLVEGIIVDELKSISTSAENLGQEVENFRIRFDEEVAPRLEQQNAVQHSLARIDKKAQRLLGLYEDELIDKDEFTREKISLESEKEFLKQELEVINQNIFSSDVANFDLQTTLSSIHNLADVYEELEHQEKKELLRTIINKVEIGKHHLDCQIFTLPKSFVNYERTGRGSWQRPA